MSLLIYQSVPADPRCETKLIALTPELFPVSTGGLNCKPCNTPIVPAATISIGRNQTASAAGSGGSYHVAFTGSPSVAGTWIVATIQDNTGTTGISGGTNPWIALGGGSGGYQTFRHLCAVSEPASYTATYSGASKEDESIVSMVEILNANSSNPDASAVATNTGTAPNVTSGSLLDCCVVCVSDAGGGSTDFNGAPSGFTMQGRIQGTSSSIQTVAIATRLNCGSGTVAPGAWANPSTLSSYLWSITFRA